MQQGELSKYKRELTSSVMVVSIALYLFNYINIIFYWVNIVTNGRHKKEVEIKEEKLSKIEHVYNINFRDGINTDTLERPNPISIIFYESDIEIVIVPFNDTIIITAATREFRINQLLVNEGSALSLL